MYQLRETIDADMETSPRLRLPSYLPCPQTGYKHASETDLGAVSNHARLADFVCDA